MIERAAWCADHDLSVGQRALLRAERAAAVQQRVAQPQRDRERGEDRGDLDGQLACRHKDQGLDATYAGIDSLEQREDKGERLAGPGAGLTDHIFAGQENGDGFGLDGSWFADALRIEKTVQGRLQFEVGERRRPRVVGHSDALTPWARRVAGP